MATFPFLAGGDSTQLSSHFEFGRNWSSFSKLIDEAAVEEAVRGLERLVPATELSDRRVLDIGCGSGLHSVAALRLGAASVLAVDLDPNSVATARQVLASCSPSSDWEVREKSVFDLDPDDIGQFDVVYSWGVLHHTGAMREAVHRAARLVAPGGLLVLALYRKTRLCPLWKIEKRLYSSAPRWVQSAIRSIYVRTMHLRFLVTGRNFRQYRETYGRGLRGMDFEHDVHDWLGGYPYESLSPAEASSLREEIGFAPIRQFAQSGTPLGLFGSGNDDYVWQSSPAVTTSATHSATRRAA